MEKRMDNAADPGNDTKEISACGGGFYEIHILGYLNDSWSEWLEGMDVKPAEDDGTMISGPVRDQARLYGILGKLSSLNLTLLSVNRLEFPREKSMWSPR